MKLNEQELIQLERIMQMLSEGKDPTSGIMFSNDTILNSDVLKKAFFQASEIFQHLIRCGAPIVPSGRRGEYKSPFHIFPDEAEKIRLSEESVSISKLTWLINSVVDNPHAKKLKATEITYWLLQNGFLEMKESEEGDIYKIPTERGCALGITSIVKTNSKGIEYALNLYSKDAQTYIVSNINIITGWV